MEFAFDDPRDLVRFDETAVPFELECRRAAGPEVGIAPGALVLEETRNEGGTRLLRYRAERSEWSGSLRVEILFEPDGRQVRGTIRVENRSSLLIRRVRFPMVTRRPVYPRDRLLFSTAWGDDVEGPVRYLRESRRGAMEYLYPSQLAMQYMVLYNPGRSLYLSAYSTGDETFALAARSRGDDALEMSCIWHPFLREGSWSSPETGFAVLRGGWHAAADLYRERMKPSFRPADRPAWMREGFHGWVQVGMKLEGRPPQHCYADLPAILEMIRKRTDIDVMHVYGWSGRGHDTLYPDYDANPELGSEEELRAAMDAIREMGGRAILYTNARLIDPESRFARTSGPDAGCCISEEGGVYDELYGTSAKTRVACPSDPVYREHLIGEIEKVITRYGAHAVQLDQVSCNPGLLCFSAGHDHESPATNFLPGYERMLRDLRTRHRELAPEFFTWAEGVHERFGGAYDVNQGHGESFTWQVGRSVPEQFVYTFPEFLVTGMCLSRWHLCWTHGQGKPFDFYLPQLEDDGFCRLVRAFVDIRRAWPAYFFDGIFRDTVGLDPMTPGIRAWRIDRRDGRGILVNLWLPGNEDGGRVRAVLRDVVPDAPVAPVYPEHVEVSREGGLAAVTWDGPLATIVWEGVRAAP